ncbi:MAG: tetratricopeptide repeat protein [Terriglobus roseus]|nr:tetratricopeptide repeat protein [Terriglobus roseus]
MLFVLPFVSVALAAQQSASLPQVQQGAPVPPPHHEANFDAERAQANQLYLDRKPLEALPLYEDLCRQDQTIAVFAERHGAGLLAKVATIADPQQQAPVHNQAIAEIRRAQRLGDNSGFVQTVLDEQTKNFIGAVITGVPLTVGYTYAGTPEAKARWQEGEAAFGHSDWQAAAVLYEQAAALDPKWYMPALDAGDAYFQMNDIAKASEWFGKAVAIDPDRETAYRYWGDALFRANDRDAARLKFVDAVVAEPYSRGPMAELRQWAQRTGHQVVSPAITRPQFITPNGVLQVDPALAASTTDGRSSWVLYQHYRVAHGARVLNQFIVGGGSDRNAVVTSPNGYEHSIAEEHAALRAMLADIEAKLKDGTLSEANLDPSLRNIRVLEQNGMLGAWIAIDAADAGIRQDYPHYRADHRKHLLDYVNTYLIR